MSGERKRQRRVEQDLHGIADTEATRYEDQWRAWRKQVKKCQRILNAYRWCFGLLPVTIDMPGTWACDWEHAVLQRHLPTKKGTPKASRGMRETAAKEFGAREMHRREAHAAIDEALLMDSDEEARDECVRITIALTRAKVAVPLINLPLCADLMSHPVPFARETDGAYLDYYGAGAYKWGDTNYELRDGEIIMWSHGLEVTKRPPFPTDRHDVFIKQHGWTVAALKRTGHGDGYKDQHRERAIEEALELVREDKVPVCKRKRGRPRVTWVVLAELGRRGVQSCVYWSEWIKTHDEDIERMLDREYASEVEDLIPELES